jgi:very-short-patch-repair endonuclease
MEVDGATHLEPSQQEYDAVRTAYLEELGYRVIRFTNNDVRDNLDAVIDEVVRRVENILSAP